MTDPDLMHARLARAHLSVISSCDGFVAEETEGRPGANGELISAAAVKPIAP